MGFSLDRIPYPGKKLMKNHRVLRNYINMPKHVRWHVGGRWRLFPFSMLETFLPPDGIFIDVGCGYGQWPLFIGYVRPRAQVFGYDPDENKIEIGNQAVGYSGLGNVHMRAQQGIKVPWKRCCLVSFIDVLYLIPFVEQEKILQEASNYLEVGGCLLVKEMGMKPRWKFAWNWLEEWLAVRLLNLTIGKRFYFRNQDEWESLIRELGFSVTTYRLDHGYIHPHILYVGKRH